MNFSEIGLGPEVLRAVEDAGYTQPTPIQEQAIPWVLQGRDVLGCAQTGTGKTASFTLPMIEILANGRARARMPRSLILEPTRELAAQVAENFETYGKHHKLNMALLIGGESFGDQIKKLDRGVDVLIATPGRMIDLFERGNILLSDIKIFVIDEADRMLDMGFIPDIERIVALLPKMRQTLFFSATMPPEIKRLADNFLMNPREVSVSPPASMAETVTHALTIVQSEDKRRALRHLLNTEDVKNALIFCNRKRDVAILHKSLEKHGFNAGALHGDMPQSKRTETLEAFKKGEITLLVCSDVAARGIDIAGLSHVFNFDTPLHAEDYVHRIGRTGRAGRQGRAFTIANPEEGKQVAAISKLIKREIPLISIDGIELAEFDEISDRRRRRPARKDEVRKEEPRKEEETKAARPPKSETRPRPEPRPEREARPDREQRAEGMRSDPPRRDRDDRRRRRDDDDDDEVVIGFGDHVPAFLLRRARPIATPEA
ncbi:DEAD/DEAH box helicase [Skermanella pratensis]|uniref:DEAD/DEAH box helicase n=1 Tax=Skermanella pratensis TaxID=2233999 RepID=UPI00130101BB|nr:DEAD/DEAH box helicase [Skermanella pratensis]